MSERMMRDLEEDQSMKQSTFIDEQSVYALRQAEQGVTAAEVCCSRE